MMDQQFQQMDSLGGPSLSSMRGLEGRMQQQMQEMDRQFDKAFADMDRVQQQLDAELQRSLRQLQEQQPGVRIERREEKAPGSYRWGLLVSGWRNGVSAHSTQPVAAHLAFGPGRCVVRGATLRHSHC